MPEPTFRGDPYQVLGLPGDATAEEIKRRRRELAREHHPDRAPGDPAEQARLTARMARINAAWDLLRDPVRRARYDASPQAQRARHAERPHGPAAGAEGPGAEPPPAPTGPPPPPPSRPVTARFDLSAAFRPGNVRTGSGANPLRGQEPPMRGEGYGQDLRASTPTGPVKRRATAPPPPPPTLAESRATVLSFGRFHGWTLGDVADRQPSYIDWIARTVTRDRDLVVRARTIAAELDRLGVERATQDEPAGTAAGGRGAPDA